MMPQTRVCSATAKANTVIGSARSAENGCRNMPKVWRMPSPVEITIAPATITRVAVVPHPLRVAVAALTAMSHLRAASEHGRPMARQQMKALRRRMSHAHALEPADLLDHPALEGGDV